MEPSQPERIRACLAIVEDDERCRVALARLLRVAGFDVDAFASAEAFLGSTRRYAGLISDVQLPGLSGVQLAEHLRDAGDPTPILFVTGSGPGLAGRVTERTHRPCLAKPVGEAQLLREVSRLLRDAG